MHREIKHSINLYNQNKMSKELEERIEKKKQMLSDYLRFAEQWNFKTEDVEKMTDIFLDDLNKLIKER